MPQKSTEISCRPRFWIEFCIRFRRLKLRLMWRRIDIDMHSNRNHRILSEIGFQRHWNVNWLIRLPAILNIQRYSQHHNLYLCIVFPGKFIGGLIFPLNRIQMYKNNFDFLFVCTVCATNKIIEWKIIKIYWGWI